MIERLRGTVLFKDGQGAVLDVGGVGFRLEMSAVSLQELPAAGDEAELFTHMHVREDALQLFAFASAEERSLFRLLIGVNKVGPRLALSALSTRRPFDMRRAIMAGEAGVFEAVPGIGKKTAERLILELREKVGELEAPGAPAALGEAVDDERMAVARAALRELGLSAQEAEYVLAGADPESPVEEIIREALTRR